MLGRCSELWLCLSYVLAPAAVLIALFHDQLRIWPLCTAVYARYGLLLCYHFTSLPYSIKSSSLLLQSHLIGKVLCIHRKGFADPLWHFTQALTFHHHCVNFQHCLTDVWHFGVISISVHTLCTEHQSHWKLHRTCIAFTRRVIKTSYIKT